MSPKYEIMPTQADQQANRGPEKCDKFEMRTGKMFTGLNEGDYVPTVSVLGQMRATFSWSCTTLFARPHRGSIDDIDAIGQLPPQRLLCLPVFLV